MLDEGLRLLALGVGFRTLDWALSFAASSSSEASFFRRFFGPSASVEARFYPWDFGGLGSGGGCDGFSVDGEEGACWLLTFASVWAS